MHGASLGKIVLIHQNLVKHNLSQEGWPTRANPEHVNCLTLLAFKPGGRSALLVCCAPGDQLCMPDRCTLTRTASCSLSQSGPVVA